MKVITYYIFFLASNFILYHEEDDVKAESMSTPTPVLDIANADEEDIIILQESEGETSFDSCLISNSNF